MKHILILLAIAASFALPTQARDAATTAPNPPPADPVAAIQDRLVKSIAKGDAAATQQWSSALASLRAAEVLNQQAELSRPISETFKAFAPQVGAISTLIKRVALPEIINSFPGTKGQKKALTAFFDADDVDMAKAAVHGIRIANNLAVDVRQLALQFESKLDMRTAIGVALSDATWEDRDRFKKFCLEKAEAELSPEQSAGK